MLVTVVVARMGVQFAGVARKSRNKAQRVTIVEFPGFGIRTEEERHQLESVCLGPESPRE